MAVGKGLTRLVEALFRPAFEVIAEETFLGLPVMVEMHLHEHQQRAEEQESPNEDPSSAGETDKLKQRITSGQRAVEVENSQSLLYFHGMNDKSLCTSHARTSAMAVISTIVSQ